MIWSIVFLIIGIMIVVAGIYYFVREKSDPMSRKIYGIVSIVGVVIAVAATIILLLLI